MPAATAAGWVRPTGARSSASRSTTAIRRSPIRGRVAGLGGFQGGLDLWRGSFLPGHRDAAGVYFGLWPTATSEVNGLVTNAAATGYVLTDTGTLNLNAYSTGALLDALWPERLVYRRRAARHILQRRRGDAIRVNCPPTGLGFMSSLEAGYPMPLPLGPRFVLEPQAQIIWQKVTFAQN